MNATAPQPLHHLEHQFEVAPSTGSASVDAEKGIIYGVSLITAGVKARGHQLDHPDDLDQPEQFRRKIDLEVDDTTLEQMLECARDKKKVPVKWNHKTGADAVSGYLKNFRIVGKKLLGDWHLLKSHERFKHALELATEMPESLGLSTSFRGKDEVKKDRAFARCAELVSADLVATPAANPGGFFEERPVDSGARGMGKPSTTADPAANAEKEFSLKDVMAGLTALNGRFDTIEERVGNIETQFQELEEETAHELEQGQQGAPEELHEFTNGEEALTYLAEKLAGIEDAREQAKVERAFEAFESKVNALTELNEQLLAENEAMAEAITEFSTKTGATVTFKPAADGGGYTHELSVPETGGRKPTTDFETRVAELSAAGKPATEAIRTAMREDPGRYQRHLQSIGVAARSL